MSASDADSLKLKQERDAQRAQLREKLPSCLPVVEAFRAFQPRIDEMEELATGFVWRRG